MFKIKKILFPIDYARPSRGAACYVEAFAGRFQAEITLLHVVDTASYSAVGTSALSTVQGLDMMRLHLEWGRDQHFYAIIRSAPCPVVSV